jgi:hypothetical protein
MERMVGISSYPYFLCELKRQGSGAVDAIKHPGVMWVIRLAGYNIRAEIITWRVVIKLIPNMSDLLLARYI